MSTTFDNVLLQIKDIQKKEGIDHSRALFSLIVNLSEDGSTTAFSTIELNKLFIYLCFNMDKCTSSLMHLINLGADPNYSEEDQTYLNNEFSVSMENITRTGTQVEPPYKFYTGLTPLMSAAAANHSNVVRFLIAEKVNVNTAARNGMTALLYAVSAGNEVVIKQLITAKANPNAMSYHGQELVDHVNLNPAERGKTVLMLAVQPNYKKLPYKDTPGDGLHKRSNGIWMPMHPTNTLEYLLASGAKPDIKSFDGSTAMGNVIKSLFFVHRQDWFACYLIDILLEHGADIQTAYLGLPESYKPFWKDRCLNTFYRNKSFLSNFVREILLLAQLTYHEKVSKSDPWLTDKNIFQEILQDLINPNFNTDCINIQLIEICNKTLKMLKYRKSETTNNSNQSTLNLESADTKYKNESDIMRLITESSSSEPTSFISSFFSGLRVNPLNAFKSLTESLGNLFTKETESKRQAELKREVEEIIDARKNEIEQALYTVTHPAFLAPKYYGVLYQLHRQKNIPLQIMPSVAQFLNCSRSPVHQSSCYTLHYNRFKTFENHFNVYKATSEGKERKRLKQEQ